MLLCCRSWFAVWRWLLTIKYPRRFASGPVGCSIFSLSSQATPTYLLQWGTVCPDTGVLFSSRRSSAAGRILALKQKSQVRSRWKYRTSFQISRRRDRVMWVKVEKDSNAASRRVLSGCYETSLAAVSRSLTSFVAALSARSSGKWTETRAVVCQCVANRFYTSYRVWTGTFVFFVLLWPEPGARYLAPWIIPVGFERFDGSHSRCPEVTHGCADVQWLSADRHCGLPSLLSVGFTERMFETKHQVRRFYRIGVFCCLLMFK